MSDRSEKVKHDLPIRTEEGWNCGTADSRALYDPNPMGREGRPFAVSSRNEDSPSVRSDRRHIALRPLFRSDVCCRDHLTRAVRGSALLGMAVAWGGATRKGMERSVSISTWRTRVGWSRSLSVSNPPFLASLPR
jgi:hypothetical protein